jgi:hypothetical protein
MEADPEQGNLGFRESQKTLLGEAIAGEIIWKRRIARRRQGQGLEEVPDQEDR